VPAGITTISALQTFVNSVPNGASASVHNRILLGAGRTYSGTTALNVNNKQHITFEGGGTEVAYGHTGGAVIQNTSTTWGVTSSSCFYHNSGGLDLVWHCLTALGSSPSSGTGAYASLTAGQGGEYAMGFCFYGMRSPLIDHCIMDRNKGDGVYLAASGTQWSSNIIVRDSTIKRNGRMGFGIIAADGIIGQRIQFEDICYSPIDYEPNQTNEGAKGIHLWEDCRSGRYSWDSGYYDPVVSITGNSGAQFPSGSLTIRRMLVHGRNMSDDTLSGSRFYFHRGAPKGWSLLMEDCDGAPAEGPAPAVVWMAGWSGASVIRNNRNMVTGSPTTGQWVYDAGGNTGARTWQTADAP
jgi:hypothetical protein